MGIQLVDGSWCSELERAVRGDSWPMRNGVSLNKLTRELGSNSCERTQRNARSGQGSTDPRNAYRNQAGVGLSREGIDWLPGRLQAAFDRYGTIPRAELDELDWPDLSSADAG